MKPTAQAMLEDIDASSGLDLSQWEQEFVGDMQDMLDTSKRLNETQYEKLHEVWVKS